MVIGPNASSASVSSPSFKPSADRHSSSLQQVLMLLLSYYAVVGGRFVASPLVWGSPP